MEMKTPVIKIGNSKGLRLSKEILERYGIRDSVDVILEDGQIVIKPIVEPRSGWKEAFLAEESHKEKLLIPDVFADEDFEEWS
jgi:antitoxin MazE